jgi:hypothetical protein
MQNNAGVDQSVSDAELIALLREAQEEMEVRGELNQLNLLLRDFAREQLRQHLLRRVEFVQMIELHRQEYRTSDYP